MVHIPCEESVYSKVSHSWPVLFIKQCAYLCFGHIRKIHTITQLSYWLPIRMDGQSVLLYLPNQNCTNCEKHCWFMPAGTQIFRSSSARPDHVRVEGWPVTRDMFSFNQRTYMSWEVWQTVLLSGGMHFVRFFSHTESNLLLSRAFGWSNNDRRRSKLIILFIKSRTLYVFLYVQIKTVKDRTLSELITIKVDASIRSWPNSL